MVDVVMADYRNPMHARAVVDLLDAYARDPAGGGSPLSAEVMAELATLGLPNSRSQTTLRLPLF